MAQDWDAIAKMPIGAQAPVAVAEPPADKTVGTLAGLGADWERGVSNGASSWYMLRALVLGDEVSDELAAENARRRALPQSEGGKAWEEADGFWEALTAFAQSPIEVGGGIAATSIRSQLQAMLEVAPVTAPAGGAVGALVGPIGAGTGAFAATVGGASALLGYTDEVMNLLEEIGLDTTNAEDLRFAFASPKIMAEVRAKAATYGGVTGLFDALSAGVGGKMTGSLAGKAVKEFAFQGAMGGAGEASASVASGKDVSGKEVLGEIIGEGTPGGGGTIEAGKRLAAGGKVVPVEAPEQAPAAVEAPAQETKPTPVEAPSGPPLSSREALDVTPPIEQRLSPAKRRWLDSTPEQLGDTQRRTLARDVEAARRKVREEGELQQAAEPTIIESDETLRSFDRGAWVITPSGQRAQVVDETKDAFGHQYIRVAPERQAITPELAEQMRAEGFTEQDIRRSGRGRGAVETYRSQDVLPAMGQALATPRREQAQLEEMVGVVPRFTAMPAEKPTMPAQVTPELAAPQPLQADDVDKLQARKDELELWIIHKSREAPPDRREGDQAIKWVSEQIRLGALPDHLNRRIGELLPETFDMETGERLGPESPPGDWPRTGTLLDFLRGQFDAALDAADEIESPLTPSPPTPPVAPTEPQGQTPHSPINVPEETRLTRFARDWQNRKEPIERLVEGVRKTRVVNEFRDVSASEKLRQGRVAHAAEKEFERRVMPLVKTVKEADLPRELAADPKQGESLAGYLQARHAPERNKHIAAINPAMPDGGSGWTTAEAEEYVAKIESGPKAEAYKLAAKQFDEINAETRRIWVKYGLETQEFVDELEAKYPNYAPLRTDMEGEAEDPVGSGISIGGYKESRPALGRTTVADDPLQFAVLQLQRAIERGERNRSFQRAFSLFGMKDIEHIATRDDPTLKRSLVTRAGTTRVENRFDPSYRTDDSVVVGKIDGVEHAIHFKEGYEDVGRALKMADAEQVPSAIRYLSVANRGLSQLFTRYNPAWVPVNAVRDLLQAALNIGAEQSTAVAAKVMGDVLSGRTYMALMHGKGPYASYVDDYKAAGGPITFANLGGLADIRKDLDAAFKEGPAQKWDAVKKFVTKLSDVSEQQARFAVFVRAVKDLGLSPEKAAILSKEASINFETRGNYASFLNSLYIFANANIQGAERFGRLLKKAATSKQAAAVLTGAVGGSFSLALLNYAMAGEDDDGRNWYDKVSPHERDRNLIVMDPTGSGKAYKIPLPPGVNFLNALGWRTAAAITRQSDPGAGLSSGKAAAGTLLSLLDAFSFTGPLSDDPAEGKAGFEETISPTTVAPTITRPFVEAYMNKDYAGRAIMPQRFPGVSKADAELYWPDVSPTAKTTARWLNNTLGGDEMKPGVVDISPESIEHVARFFAGGPARILGQFYNMGEKAAKDLPIESYEVPLANRFYSSPSEQRIAADFRRDVAEVLEVEKRLKAVKKGELSSTKEAERDSPLFRLIGRAKTKKALVEKVLESNPERAKKIMQEFSADVVEAKRLKEAG